MSRLCVISISVSILTAVSVCIAVILESMLNEYYIEFQELRQFKRTTQEHEEAMKSSLEDMNSTLQALKLQLLKNAKEKEDSEKRATKCPSYFSKFRSSCYMIYPYRMTWPEAYTFCQAVGAHLVYIEDKEEHDFLKGLAARTGHTAPQLWTGILEYMGRHIVFAGSGQSAPYLSFKPGEPSTSPTDDCVALNKVVGYAMEDYNCAAHDNRFSLICEIDLFKEK